MTSGGTGGGTGGDSTNNIPTSVPMFENKVAIDGGFITIYGNLHGHSTHSDGRASTGEPVNDMSMREQPKEWISWVYLNIITPQPACGLLITKKALCRQILLMEN